MKYLVLVSRIWYIASFYLWIHVQYLFVDTCTVFVFISKQMSLHNFTFFTVSKHKTGVSMHMIGTTLKYVVFVYIKRIIPDKIFHS